MHTLFNRENAHLLRAYLARHTPELGSIRDPGVSVAVINAADQCALTCPNCLYSAALAKKVFDGSPPYLRMEQMQRFVELMNDAGAELLVFSGGGESYENLEVMCYAVEHMHHIRQVVTITSAYFAESPEATARMLDRLTDAMRRGNMHRGSEITFTLRISYDTFHNVPIEYILHTIRYALANSRDGVNIRPIIRTILDPSENMDIHLAEQLSAKLVPGKDPNDPTRHLPIIDAFPTRWLCIGDLEIPVIYKPTYFLGLAAGRVNREVPGTSWREVKAAEETVGRFFNLSRRGVQGEGHNFYETILRGYKHWSSVLGSVPYYLTPCAQQSKRLSVYLPADGRMIINASAPDSWQSVEVVNSWVGYWERVSADLLQRTAVTQPTETLLTYAREVEPEIEAVLDGRNFVFQVPYSAMETGALRLYLTVRLLQGRATNGVQFADPVVRQLVQIQPSELIGAYRMARITQSEETLSRPKPLVIDPIIGNQASIWSDAEYPQAQLATVQELMRHIGLPRR